MSGAVLRAVKVGLSIKIYRCFGTPYSFKDRDKIMEEGELLAIGRIRKGKIEWSGRASRANEKNVEIWEKLQVIC